MIFRTFLLLSFIKLSLFATDLESEFYSIIHAESETTFGKDNNSSYPQESNSFATLYANLSLTYDISDDVFISSAMSLNYVLDEESYTTPLYLRSKLTSDDINKVVLSELSLNYDNNFFSLNIGRNEVNYDWINGSIDGVIAMVGDDDSYAFRLFWFNQFSYLQYNYYVDVKDINEKEGMYGAIFSLKKEFFRWNLFNYYMQDLRNIAGGSFELKKGDFLLRYNYTIAKALALASYDYDESFSSLSLQQSYANHTYELGVSLTGENGLLAMIQLGNFMLSHFYLSNQVDREDAKNLFARYSYTKQNYRFSLLAGWTNYNNSFEILEENLKAQEVDAHFAYGFNKNLMVDVGLMYMNVDERDPISITQALITTNLVYKYESF